MHTKMLESCRVDKLSQGKRQQKRRRRRQRWWWWRGRWARRDVAKRQTLHAATTSPARAHHNQLRWRRPYDDCDWCRCCCFCSCCCCSCCCRCCCCWSCHSCWQQLSGVCWFWQPVSPRCPSAWHVQATLDPGADTFAKIAQTHLLGTRWNSWMNSMNVFRRKCTGNVLLNKFKAVCHRAGRIFKWGKTRWYIVKLSKSWHLIYAAHLFIYFFIVSLVLYVKYTPWPSRGQEFPFNSDCAKSFHTRATNSLHTFRQVR